MFKKCLSQVSLLGMSLVLMVLVSVVASKPTLGASFALPLPTPSDLATSPFNWLLPSPVIEAQARIALEYIARHESIPLDDLLVAHQHQCEYPLLGRRFMSFTIFDRTARRDFRLLVDLNDSSVVDNVASIEQAEVEARHTKYGKPHPLLYRRLQIVDAEEVLPVAIWVDGERGHSREHLYALLARRYSQVRNALAHHASPFDVDNPVFARQTRTEYERMRQEDIVARIQPLATYLESQGIAVKTYYLLPSITAMLSREEILAMVQRDDVQIVYLVEGEEKTELDTAVHTNHVTPVWLALGIDGIPEPTIPITIAIVERDNVDWDNSFLHHASRRLVAVDGEQDHATWVANAAAGFYSTYRGMAPGTTILSAGTDGTISGVHFALTWALDQGTDVVNLSPGFRTDTPELEWLDRAFDYTARERQATIIKSAGNHRDEHITPPGKGWNVITVGGINDQDNADWSDDTMYEVLGTDVGSAYLDPNSANGDREKPEIAAPGQNIRTIGMNDVPDTQSGTSLAAPQVSGLVALLMHDNADLKDWPTAIKAILMASAMHNVEGDSRLSDEDGAGSIDATRVYTIAHHHRVDGTTCWEGSCWWAVDTTSTYPAPGDWLYQHFYAEQGDLIRVAIAWWSEADSPPDYPTLGDDALTSNFNLYVWDPDDELLTSGYSVSWDNNYEIVQFSAPKTGLYEIGAYKSLNGTTESDNQVGVAVLRIHMPYRVYLPMTLRDAP